MKNVTILILKGCNLSSFETPRRAFITVNEHLLQEEKKEIFNVVVAGISDPVELENGLYTIHPDRLIGDVKDPGLIIIPALSGDISKCVQDNKDVIPWLIKHYHSGAEIASLCIGAFLLATTGLLDGKLCSTHWQAKEQFKNLFPLVNLMTEKIMTDENGIYTSGGSFSSANLVLYLIEKYAGRESSVYCSKIFQVDMGRHSQSPFVIFKGQKEHADEYVMKAQEFIEENYSERISIDRLASHVLLSRRSFERRFKKATSNSALEYMQRVKIEAAKKRLETSMENVNEVMYDVGYNDPKAFRDIFRKITGLSPGQYRNRYHRNLEKHQL